MLSESKRRREVVLLLLTLLASLSLLHTAGDSSAQSTAPVYWRYDVPGRLDQLTPTDIDHDGIDEFVVVAGGNRLILVGSDGRAMWPVPFQANDIIVDAEILNLADLGEDTSELAVAVGDSVLLLDHSGNQHWELKLPVDVALLERLPVQQDAGDELLVAMQDGRLWQIDAQGEVVHRYTFSFEPAQRAEPHLIVADLEKSDRSQIVYAYYAAQGFARLVVFEPRGQRLWGSSNNGRTVGLSLVEFNSEGPSEIALATSNHLIHLYTAQGERRWPYRSVNVPISVLTTIEQDDQHLLIIGTEAGTIIAYDSYGRRQWDSRLHEKADRPVRSVSSVGHGPHAPGTVSLAVVLGQPRGSSEPSDVLLLDSAGRQLEPSYREVDIGGLSRLTDINRDGRAELLLARFATLELLDPGVGARQYSEAWAFRLGAEPQTMLVADVDGDQQSELLVGTRDGRVQALSSAGLPLWEVELGGIVTHLALASTLDENAPQLVAVYNDVSSPDSSSEGLSGHVAILRPDGKSVSQSHIDGPVSSLLIADINRSGPPEILLGTSDGQVVARSLSGDDFWSTRIDGSVESLSVVSGLRGAEIIVSSGANRLERINHKGSGQKELGQYVADIVAVEQRVRGQDLLPILLIALEDGTVRGLDSQGSQLWLTTVEGLSGPMLATGESLLLATENGQVARLSLQGDLQWRTGDLERITTMYWGDLDGDVQPDLAVGNNLGTVALISADGLRAWGQLRLNSAVEQIVALPPEPGAPAELATLTDNGVVQLFRSQANRPPLLISPEEEVSPGRYSITVSVVDVDGDSVTVDLEVLNPDTQRWDLVDTKVAPDGNDTLFWPLDPPEGPNGIRYRFSYDDGTHQGQLSPLSGPAAVRSGPVVANFALLGFLALSATAAAVLLVRQSRSPASQAKRLFEQARERPAAVIELIEADYQETHASPDLLLNLANRARKADNQLLADLADGLFLLPTRPESGLHIVVEALETAADAATPWHGLHRWTVLFRTAHTLYGAPSISELSLMRGRLSLLQQHVLPNGSDEQPFNLLMPALETVHDGERVDLSADRLLYLREAARKLEDATGSLTDEPASVERTVARVLAERWLGLIRAGIEELQGRAQLSVNLVTKRLVPDDDAVVAIEVQNVGRAPAHNLQVVLADDPTYAIRRQPEKAPLLLPGRKRLFHASFAPGSSRRFRVLFNLHYQDKNGQDRSLPYADMVHLLATEREFAPIDNPYAPGMPLRQNSLLFFGREDLFEFIAQNAHSEAARNVLILVGQRRTGKTSALLQLRRHLPPSLVPVYIDCQSLGVIPGMPALFHNLAWTIADSLGEHGIELPVPPLSAWQSDPGGHFQRDFIAGAQARLPADNTILLVFDEFEVFEDLVNDEILPPTLFTYMRHLMQHGEGLSFIFAGTHRLEDMSTDYWSVLFNIALYRQVGFLDSEAARRLIQEPVSPQLVFDDLAIDKILRVTAGHPYFLQLVCYALVNRANTERRGYVTISDVNAALEQMLRLGEVHFAYLWQRSTYGERALLAALARASDQDQPFHLEDLVDYLERYNIRLDAAEATAAVGRLIQREIVRELADQHTPTYELRIGLVGLWVAENKSLTRLYEARPELDLVRYG